MSKLTAAYIAGFVDGEGYISIYPYVRKDRENQVYYKASFKVSNTNKEIIEWLKSSFGGYIYTRTPKNPNDNISYTWSLDAKNTESVLKSIQPYLKIKKRQCELVLERIRLRYKQGMGPIKDQTIQKRVVEIYNELRVLNKRGTNLHAKRLSEKTSKEEATV